MKQFSQLKQYNQVSKGLRFPLQKDEPYILFYFPENSILLNTYPFLNLRIIDFKNVIVPLSKIPRTRLLSSQKKEYRDLRLYATSSNEKIPSNKNLIFDYSVFLKALQDTYKPTNYRQRTGFLIQNFLYMSSNLFPPTYQKILLYNISLDKEFDKNIINRKLFPVLQQMKKDEFYFDSLLLGITYSGDTLYRLLVKDKIYSFPRVFQYLKTIKPIDIQDEEEKELNNVTNNILDKASKSINPKDKEKVRVALNNYLLKSKDELNKVSKKITPEDAERIVLASLMNRSSGQLSKSKKISSSIPKKIGRASCRERV